METLLKWLNKPKADDKSLLARFFHADRALAQVANELDSFDGRTEPDRCSRLVTRLRQGQDKVLAITDLIIEELLGDERESRAFRAKFPEEVLQENLAGQLWFGAECLAAGSSIMNREQESKEMRPLAEAVTRSLNNVRYLLRDQCLRNNVPNSERLHLDKNDAATEQLFESLKIFDRLFAEFEWRYVSAMVQVKSKDEYEMQELICVLCSETLQRALKVGLLDQEQVDAFDPALMFSIPRLAIVTGLVIYPEGPLNLDMPAEQLSEMFRPFRSILIKVREYLKNLNKKELYHLEHLLCTNENISLKNTLASNEEVDNNNGDSSRIDRLTDGLAVELGDIEREKISTFKLQKSTSKIGNTKVTKKANSPSPAPSTSSSSDGSHSRYTTPLTTPSTSPRDNHSLTSSFNDYIGRTTPSVDSWTDDEDGEDLLKKPEILCHRNVYVGDDREHDAGDDADDDDTDSNKSDGNHGVDAEDAEDSDSDIQELDNVVEQIRNLEIPNTCTAANLLQPDEVCFSNNFIVNDGGAELLSAHDSNDNLPSDELPTTSAKALQIYDNGSSSSSSSTTTTTTATTTASLSSQCSDELVPPSSHNVKLAPNVNSMQYTCKRHHHTYAYGKEHLRSHRHHHHYRQNRHHKHRHYPQNSQRNQKYFAASGGDVSENLERRHHYHHHHHHRRCRSKQDNRGNNECDDCCSVGSKSKEEITVTGRSAAATSVRLDIDSPTTSSSVLENNKSAIVGLKNVGRLKFKHTENLLHRLFVCIAGVADQLQTNFAFDLRQILRSVFLMNMTPTEDDDVDIPKKAKENELFEFRASENDVVQESAGSSQSIYSAEEVNPEDDSQVSSSSSGNEVTAYRHSTGSTATTNTSVGSQKHPDTTMIRQQIERSHSLDNHESAQNINDTTSQRSEEIRQFNRSRYHSTGSNTPSSFSSSENSSPVYERSSSSPRRINTINSTQSTAAHLSPPAWIPDQKAPRCMSCNIPFTAFRRRHHCRNCGGVFCGVCSNTSAPLPKYGLTKAVRVCRSCYVHEVNSHSHNNQNSGFVDNTNNESRLSHHLANTRARV
uniref:Lateral signaling target protein 2 homolog n=1 Tax=Glossina palpalis gambiensis TaxID=67801 RepID=A0A1B0C2V1_9MUSC